jgi:predicted nucleotidyltransferase/HEPN domain-containing protein
MDQSLSHLPLRKRFELERVVETILAASEDVAMIILYGSYARGGWKEAADLSPNRRSGHVSDYDILVITGGKAAAYDTVLWEDVAMECRGRELSAHVRIIAHDIDFVNGRLTEGQYFFKDIAREGKMLYDPGEVILSHEKRFTPKQRRRIAQGHFDSWFDDAQKLFKAFGFCFGEGDYKQAAFLLHQTAETAYKTLLLVLTNYCPHEHYLGVLGLMAAELDGLLRDIFPQETKEQRDRFKHFDYAYIGGRYDPKYRISKDDLDYFSARVKRLLELTEEICLANLADENFFWKEL